MSNESEVLMQVTHSSGKASLSESSTQNSIPTVTTMQVSQKKKPGRPKTTHRNDDEELFKQLRNNPDGKDVKRTDWQILKWEKFKSG